MGRSLLGWTPTRLPKKTNIKTSKKRSRASATPSSPSCTKLLVEPQEACLVVCQELLVACLELEQPLEPDPDPLLKKLTKSLMIDFFKNSSFSNLQMSRFFLSD